MRLVSDTSKKGEIMKYSRLESNIKEMLVEQQLKLGYEKGAVGLYYSADSLKNILEKKGDSLEELDRELEGFAAAVRPRLGQVEVSRKKDRYCIQIPPKGALYVHEHKGDTSFLERFLKVIQKHDCTIEEIVAVFREFSSDVVCEDMADDEFDYLVYFGKADVDAHRYCIKKEGSHMTYHRFTREDYSAMFCEN